MELLHPLRHLLFFPPNRLHQSRRILGYASCRLRWFADLRAHCHQLLGIRHPLERLRQLEYLDESHSDRPWLLLIASLWSVLTHRKHSLLGNNRSTHWPARRCQWSRHQRNAPSAALRWRRKSKCRWSCYEIVAAATATWRFFWPLIDSIRRFLTARLLAPHLILDR